MQCWLYMYSIRGQIIMSHYFHIKKKSIIISIVLVKFLTVVRWMYNIPSERCHLKYEHNAQYQRVRDACVTRDSLRKLQFSKLTPKNSLNLHTQSLEDQWLQFALAFIFSLRWVICCVFTDRGFYIINIFKQRLYLATFVRFYLSSATFNTFNIIWNYVLNTGKDRRQHLSRRPRAIIWITLELRTQVSVISALITLSPDAALILKKCDVLSNSWPLMIGPNGEEPNFFSQ